MVIGYNGKQHQVFLIICNKIKPSYSGVVDDDVHFKYGYNTEVYYSCAASWNDEMWVLGGISKKRQVKFLKTF